MNFRSKIIRLAASNPGMRPHLLPLVKWAMEFPTEEAFKKYMKDHPGADPKNHSVTKPAESKGEGKGKRNIPDHLSEKDRAVRTKTTKAIKDFLKKNQGILPPKGEGKTWGFSDNYYGPVANLWIKMDPSTDEDGDGEDKRTIQRIRDNLNNEQGTAARTFWNPEAHTWVVEVEDQGQFDPEPETEAQGGGDKKPAPKSESKPGSREKKYHPRAEEIMDKYGLTDADADLILKVKKDVGAKIPSRDKHDPNTYLYDKMVGQTAAGQAGAAMRARLLSLKKGMGMRELYTYIDRPPKKASADTGAMVFDPTEAISEFLAQVHNVAEDLGVAWEDGYKGSLNWVVLTGEDERVERVGDYLQEHGFRVKTHTNIPIGRDRWGAPDSSMLRLSLEAVDSQILRSRDVAHLVEDMTADTYRDGDFRVRLGAYSGNPDGKPIYDHEIDHGYGQPLAGGTDVMRRLQNQYRKEQGLPERPSNPEIPKMAARVAMRHIKNIRQ